MYYVGLDLHQRYVTVCAMDSEGQVVARQERLPTAPEPLRRWLQELGGPATVAVEATLHWAWVHDRLAAAGYPVVVAHPQQVKLICHARCKTDKIDARKLADLLRTNLLPAIWVPDPATRARRTLLRGRAWLVRMRTRVKARIHGYLAAVALPPAVRGQVDRLLVLVEQLDAQITSLDRAVRELLAETPQAALLQSVPGIGPFGALLILAEIGDLSRFGSSHELAAYAGLVPSTHSSGGKTAHGPVGPAGSAWLKWIFIEAVQTLKRQPGPVRRHYERLLVAKGKPKATVAAARKLCCYVYWMLKQGRSYQDSLRQREEREVRPAGALASVV